MELDKHFKLNSMLRYITVILFIVCTTVKAGLTPKTDRGTEKYFDVEEKELVLQCDGASKLTWSKNGTDIKSVTTLKDEHGSRFEIRGNQLVMKRLEVEDAGTYICTSADGETAEINVVANAYAKKIPENMSVVEGEKLKIHCKALGTDPEVMWHVAYDGRPEVFQVANGLRVSFLDADNVKHAILVIESAMMEDRGSYNCTVRNRATEFNIQKYPPFVTGTFVRVKGKLAALWPFLGICAEVLILCAIILVYEKRRNKEGLDESDTDQSPEQEKLKTGK